MHKFKRVPLLIKVGFTFILFCTLFIFSLYPTLFVDESLYVGAALKLLNGDLLLTDYWFDKPFMQFYWIIPGILLFGKNVVGFSFSGVLASTIAFWKFPKIVPGSDLLYPLLVAVLFVTNPFNLQYFSSAMAEPFLFISFTFYTTYYFRYLQSQNRSFLRSSYIWFALSFCVKQSTFMLTPMYFMVLLSANFTSQNIWKETKYFFKSSKWVWLIALIYQVSNTSKFAALTWFRKLANQKDPKTLIEHLLYWPQNIFNTQRSTLTALLVLGLFASYIIYVLYKAKK